MKISDKETLRALFRKKRSALTANEVTERSRQINQNFISNLLPKIYHKNSDKIFSIYSPLANEVSTDLLSEHFKKNQILFSYPKITKLNNHLDFLLAEENQIFAPNNFYPKILEPLSGEKVFPDFLILPLLAFDRQFSRLGMGGGFFDRTISFLKKQKSSITTIGLAYCFQRANETIGTEETDQKLDFIATEEVIFSASLVRP